MGSPPRRRGRLARPVHGRRHPGLTPAQAGTARVLPAARYPERAHPRAGGDGRPSGYFAHGSGGSPPRRRGRPWYTRCRNSRPVAHPRAGGDGASTCGAPDGMRGSPPRRRGRPVEAVVDDEPAGLTPAQAGTARSGPASGRSRRAHPRAGGDGGARWHSRGADEGSPPRRRGRRTIRLDVDPGTGAHPRAGGDGVLTDAHCCLLRGSPPRRRGRPVVIASPLAASRLTPAQAGTAGWPFGQ